MKSSVRRLGVHDLRDRELRVARGLHEVGVGQDAALRPPHRARRVDERRKIVALGDLAAPLDLLVLDVLAAGDELVEVTGVDLPGTGDGGDVGADLVEAREVLRGLGEDRDGAGVGQVPEDLGRGAGLVDRHEHRAGEPGREVDERPLVAGLAHHPDLVAGFDPGGDQALGERDDLRVELLGGHLRPATVAGGEREERTIRCRGHPLDQEVA